MFKDEKKYADADVVEILDTFEQWIQEIYTKAGQLGVNDGVNPEPVPACSRPDQPGAHVQLEEDKDPMKHVCVPLGGDQLTRVRCAGAKDLHAGGHTAKDRFEHCSPFVIEA